MENDESARRNLRELLFTSPQIEDYISGVVRFAFWFASIAWSMVSFTYMMRECVDSV